MANNSNIPIIRLKESDIISESMHIINQNFESIANNYDISNFKWEQYSKKIMEEINKLKKSNDRNNINITKTIDDLNERMDNISSENDIQSMVNKAILEAGQDLSGFIKELAGQQIDKALGTYVKSSQLIRQLSGYATQTDLDGYATKTDLGRYVTNDDLGEYVKEDELPNYDLKYVSSNAFDTFKADASKQYASASRIVSNNKLYRTAEGYLVYDSDGDEPEQHIAGGTSRFKTIEEFYNNNVIKNKIDPTGKGIEDPDVTAALITEIEKTFRVISTELSLFKQEVKDGSALFNIVAAVENPETGKPVAASIFGYADKDGSKLMLNADQINLSANHKLKLGTGTFELKSNNLTIDESGLVLTGNNGKTRIGVDGILHARGADIQGDITANKFISNPSQTTETIGSDVWTFERSSVMDDHEFRVSSSRTKGSTVMEPSHIYITILPEYTLENQQENQDLWNDSDNGKLMGVPVLCFEYNGKPYYLTPGVWKSSGGSTARSNIYWGKLSDIYSGFEYMGNLSSKANYRLAFTNYHIFKPSVNNELVSYVSKPFYRVYYDTSNLSGDDLTNANTWLDNNGLRNSAGVYSISDNAANYGTSVGNTRDITESMCNIFGGMKFTGKIFKTPVTTINKNSLYTSIHTIETYLSLNGSIVNYICSEDVFGWDNNWTPTIDCVDSYTQTNYGGDFIQFLHNVYSELDSGTRNCKAAKKVEYTYSEDYNNGVKTGSNVTGIYVKTTYGIVVDLSDKEAVNRGGNREIFNVTTAEILVSFNSYFDYSSSPINESSVVSTITNSLKSSSLSEQDIQNHIRFEGVIWGIPKNTTTPDDEPIVTYGNVNLNTWRSETIFQEIDS